MINRCTASKAADIFLMFSGALLFGLNNCLISWFVYVPVLILVYRCSFKNVWIYGGIYGIFSIFFYVNWLFKFSTAAFAGAGVLYFFYCSILFIILKAAMINNRIIRFVLLTVILCLYEFVKTKGFAGFSYGVNGYNQAGNLYLIQIADFSGVWGVSFLLNYFSVLFFELILSIFKYKKNVRNNYIFIAAGILMILFSLLYGNFRINGEKNQVEKSNSYKIAAIQNNSDPWKGGIDFYEQDVKNLIDLTDNALKENPDIDIVIWPETAVVPDIKKHFHSITDERRHKLIAELLEYIDSKKCGFVIGNFNSVLNNGIEEDYNSAFLFIPGKNVIPPEPEVYSKIHLVPFTESFPYEKIFPAIYKILLDGDNHLWTPGKELKVFEYKGLKFSTPICFEDNFGNDCRKFEEAGAQAFFNLSNDAWSHSLKCQKQHLQMAVFRSVENHIPTVRSTASGQTCIIDSTGKIVSMCRPFEKGYVVHEINVKKDRI